MLEISLSGVQVVLLHLSPEHGYIPRPAESHHTFGSGFILVGLLMTAERLSGSVWYRSRFRTMIFPATLVTLGWGMIAVTVIEPNARIAHFAMGLPMIIGGWAEARYRLGQMPRSVADAFLIPALFFAAIDTAVFHLQGPLMSGGFLTHASLALTALAIAGLRYWESGNTGSLMRGLAMTGAVMLVAVELYADALFL